MGSTAQTRKLRNNLVLMLLSAVAGCSTAGGGDRHPSAQLRAVTLTPEASTVWLTAASIGTIEPIGSCVYFVTGSGQRRLALWPDGFALERRDGVAVGVRYTRSGKGVAFGATHTFGSGELSALSGILTDPLPADCNGPAMMLWFH